MRSEFLARTRWSVSLTVLVTAVLTACGGGEEAGSSTTALQASSSDQQATESVSPADNGNAAALAGATTAAAESTDAAATSDDLHTEQALSMARSGRLTTDSTAGGAGGVSTGAGTVTLSWAAPLTQANGSTVATLAGYRIYYGMASGKYVGSVFVQGGAAGGGTVTGLTTGKWYFTVAAVDSVGNQSTLGYELSKSL